MARVQVILDRLVDVFPMIPHVTTAPQATLEQLHAFHTPLHVNSVLKWCGKIERSMEELDRLATDSRPASAARRDVLKQYSCLDIDGDTTIMRYTREAALHAAGAACAAVDAVMTGACTNAFCAVRPPGHHAEPHKAMGFCFFNNIGVAAMHAIHAHGVRRVAIVDFDVHHGNGTDTKARRAAPGELLYISTHQKPPCFPGTGIAADNTSNVCNVEMDESTSSATFRSKFVDHVEPKLLAYNPELLLISAGFDAHRDDPLANVNLTADDFYWVTSRLVDAAIAGASCRGRIVSVLEGGYHLRALADSAEAHVRALTECFRALPAPHDDQIVAVELCQGMERVTVCDALRPSLRLTLSSVHCKAKHLKTVVVVLAGGMDVEAQWMQLRQAAAAKLNMKKSHKLRTKEGRVVEAADALLALANDAVLYMS
ncbi:hypothetical protein, variant [Aphanomyces invadans]|uniref:histone deacetylase n=1 Tax=Aphanomyces invadans TaxID=157072 RepID=A0A024TB72_9STRA|nr:hypothetical protein, variant [Aphanomyces invadans]ETV91380.1 hypothetical protein, variant [Aphanomyces invadans]|eukprot:XP_008880008.1 hypothetical protein, variant [Aphanomyces invadans]